MHAAPVVFCERTGNWAAAWRRVEARRSSRKAGRDFAGRVMETRSPAECREVVAAHHASFVVVELSSTLVESALELLFDLGVEHADAACGVVADRPMRAYEFLARELGALAFVVSPLELESLCEVAERHIGRSVVEPADVRQRIWENLPWK